MSPTHLASRVLLTLLVLWSANRHIAGDEWPTYRHDHARSGYSDTSLNASALDLTWTWESPARPNPAWDGPARWDAYAAIKDLPSMRQYDAAFHPVSDGKRVYFGSNAQDTLFALDAQSGEQVWTFTAGGPVRLAPTLWEGHVYFGADDGCAYCVDAETGSLRWRYFAASAQQAPTRKIVSNDRLISAYPVRTGVLIREGIAYFGAGLLPWRNAYLCAVDARSGEVSREGTYIREYPGGTFEGTLLVADQRLLVPQGRVAPKMFDRRDGTPLGDLPGGGGVTMVVADQGQVIRAEGGREARGGQIGVFRAKERIATFPKGRAMVVRPETIYVIDDHQIFAARRTDQELRWTRDLPEPVELIMGDATLFVGAKDEVLALSAETGAIEWRHPVAGRAHGLALTKNQLIVATDQGGIYVFTANNQPAPRPAEEVTRTLTPNAAVGKAEGPEPPQIPDFLSWGPVVQFTAPRQATIRYGTRAPSPTIVGIIDETGVTTPQGATDAGKKTTHLVVLDDLPFREIVNLVIQHPAHPDGFRFSADTHFDWSPAPNTVVSRSSLVQAAADIGSGMALVLGEPLGDAASELAAATSLAVIHWVPSEQAVRDLRRRQLAADVRDYGRNFCVTETPLRDLPAAFAALVVTERDTPEARRLVRPRGKLVVGGETVWTRPPLAGAGHWSHMYGGTDNSAYGGETLSGAQTREELVLQWLGRPGPRYKSDRQNRKPSPLAAGGRLYLQGLQRLIAMDAYSGSILWNLETPTVMRWNVPHDCSNWCADSQQLFVAAQDQVWALDGVSGERTRAFTLPDAPTAAEPRAWGYLARHDDWLLGSEVADQAIYRKWWGGARWFDSKDGDDTHIVLGRNLFAYALDGKEPAWVFTGNILHPTITAIGDRIYFVTAEPTAEQASQGRVPINGDSVLRLVCLDSNTGRQIWETGIAPFDGHVACLYLAAGGEASQQSLILAASESKHERFRVTRFDFDSGTVRLEKPIKWEANHHGKHISRPAIQGDILYLRPVVLRLNDGKTLRRGFPAGHGCTSYALCAQGLFSRLGEVTWWDPRTKTESRFPRVRTDCWISTIPAEGMVLSAEGGGGCSCGSWMETSMAFLPRAVDSQASQP